LVLASLALILERRGDGYIMPSEQLIDFMAKNFSKIETLVIIQSTQQEDPRDEMWRESFVEKIWIKSPDLFRSQIINRTMGRFMEPDFAYRQLLVSNTGQMVRHLLSRMGINLHSVGLTRIEGAVAYRIGDKEPESPKILIDKERFLPLLLMYRLPERTDGGKITVRFKDYRELDQGWYPFEITYSEGGELQEGYTVQTLEANVPIESAVFDVQKVKSSPEKSPVQEKGPQDDEPVREIIKRLEEKYR
jgi:hypothetical protein